MFRTLPRFEYLSPASIEEAMSMLNQHGQKAKILAGGTDLIPQMKWGEQKPEYVVALSRISGLDDIEYNEKKGLTMGAFCKIAKIEKSHLIRKYYPLLSQAASELGSMEIRNRGTVGGNLCTALPSADMPPALLTLDSRVVIATKQGERTLPLEEFFSGPKQTVLKNNEILLRLEIPPMKPNSAGEYLKFGRRKAMEIAMIGVAALLTVEPKENICIEAKLAYATAAPTPCRAREAEKILAGNKLDDDTIMVAAQMASRETSPRTSWRTTEEYRQNLILVLTQRAIKSAWEKIS